MFIIDNEQSIKDTRLAIFEAADNGDITAEQKEAMLERVAEKEAEAAVFEAVSIKDNTKMLHTLAITSACIAGGALITLTTAKVIQKCKINGKIEDSEKLSSINAELKKAVKTLKAKKKELNKIIREYNAKIDETHAKADYHATKEIRSTQGTSHTVGQDIFTTTGITINKGKETVKSNIDYDMDKAKALKKEAHEMEELVQRYKSVKSEINAAKKEIKSLKSEFYTIVKRNCTDEEADKIMNKINDVMDITDDVTKEDE